jgi:hypothetical protein
MSTGVRSSSPHETASPRRRRSWLGRALSGALPIVLSVVSLTTFGAEASAAEPVVGLAAAGVQLGAYADGMDADPSRLTRLEQLVGRQVGTASVFRAADEVFPAAADLALTDGGRRTLLVSWHLDTDRYAAWAAGAHDDVLDRTARAVAQYGRPLYIRPWAEMNADWVDFQPTADGSRAHGGTPAEFVAAWRHVVDRFRAAGATNARWVFNPTADVYAETTPVEVIWPGRQYVDVLGLDGYNWGTYSFLRWRSFSDIFTAQYQRLTALAGDLPVWVCEVSSADPQSDAQRVQVTAPAGQDKGSWWRDALATTTLPKITTLVLFSINKERDWRVESTPGALEGLRAGLQAGATPTSAATASPTATATSTSTPTTTPTATSSTASPTATTASPSATTTVTTTVTATPKTTTTTTTTKTTPKPKPKTTATPKVVAPAARTRPRVVGTPRVGRVLRATRGSWTGRPTTYRYTWKADGRTVRSSVSPRIRLSRALHGKRLTVVVRATRPGAPAGTATSAASGRVRR